MGTPFTPAPTATRASVLLVLCGEVQTRAYFRLEETFAPQWERLINPGVFWEELHLSLAYKLSSIKLVLLGLLVASAGDLRGIRTERLGTVKLPKPLGGFLIPQGNRLRVV